MPSKVSPQRSGYPYLQHNNRIAPNDLLIFINHHFEVVDRPRHAHHHAYPNLFSARLFLYRLIQDDVEEDLEAHISLSTEQHTVERSLTYIIASQNTNDLPAAVQLDEEPLVKVLEQKS